MKKLAFLLLFLCSAAHAQWSSVTYSAGNFSAPAGMTWSVPPGGVQTYKYIITGKTMVVSFYITGTNVSGTLQNTLMLAVPEGKLATSVMVNAITLDNGGQHVAGFAYTVTGSNWITIARTDEAIFIADHWTYVYGQITFEFM